MRTKSKYLPGEECASPGGSTKWWRSTRFTLQSLPLSKPGFIKQAHARRMAAASCPYTTPRLLEKIVESARSALTVLAAIKQDVASAELSDKQLWSRRACVQRLRSFASRVWVEELASPEECARHGWRCEPIETSWELRCNECNARISESRLRETKSIEVHERYCVWNGAPLPATIWEDDADVVRSRIDRIRRVLPEISDQAQTLACSGWVATDGLLLECSLCSQTAAPTQIDHAASHRRFCPFYREHTANAQSQRGNHNQEGSKRGASGAGLNPARFPTKKLRSGPEIRAAIANSLAD